MQCAAAVQRSVSHPLVPSDDRLRHNLSAPCRSLLRHLYVLLAHAASVGNGKNAQRDSFEQGDGAVMPCCRVHPTTHSSRGSLTMRKNTPTICAYRYMCVYTCVCAVHTWECTRSANCCKATIAGTHRAGLAGSRARCSVSYLISYIRVHVQDREHLQQTVAADTMVWSTDVGTEISTWCHRPPALHGGPRACLTRTPRAVVEGWSGCIGR